MPREIAQKFEEIQKENAKRFYQIAEENKRRSDEMLK